MQQVGDGAHFCAHVPHKIFAVGEGVRDRGEAFDVEAHGGEVHGQSR
jgi:hypothetical protein